MVKRRIKYPATAIKIENKRERHASLDAGVAASADIAGNAVSSNIAGKIAN